MAYIDKINISSLYELKTISLEAENSPLILTPKSILSCATCHKKAKYQGPQCLNWTCSLGC